jgi:hypothetical protein
VKGKIGIYFLAVVLLTGCGTGRTAETGEQQVVSEQQTPEQAVSETENTIPGSYTVPEGWIRAEKYSTAEKIFYVEDGKEIEDYPDNISIEVGSNRYAAKDHANFRNAILQQLLLYTGTENEVLGDGTYTEQGYILYIFTITEESEGIVTKQYYIVDDYRYCLVQLTNFTGSEAADEAAREMVDSFIWDSSDSEG